MIKVDLTGKTFYDLYVEKEVEPKVRADGRNNRMWQCKCICGNSIIVPTNSLTSGNTKSCGCRKAKATRISRARDLTGQTFYDLHVESRAQYKQKPNGTYCSMWNCTCKCGKEVLVPQNALVSGTTKSCGCRNTENGIKRRKDLTGMRFGMYTVDGFAYTRKTPSGQVIPYWHCTCDCGTKKDVSGNTLKNGYAVSCGCYRKEYLKENKTIDLTGAEIGWLKVEGRSKETPYDEKRKRALWDCVCQCGRRVVLPSDKLLSGHTMSCGCLGSSKGENEVAILLDKLDVNYKHWYVFDDLRGKKNMPLPFDFAILGVSGELLGLIEYQGEQHYKEKTNGFGDVQRLRTDPMKKEYCKKKNILLCEIRYDEDIPTALSKCLSTIFSHANTVPSSNSEKV